MGLSTVIAWYGAVLSTAVALYQWRRQWPRLVITVRRNDPVRQDVHPDEPGRPRGVVVLRNPTTVGIVLERVLLSREKQVVEPFLLLADRYDSGSQTIGPGASEEFMFELREALHHGMRWVIAEAQDGRRWSCPLRTDRLGELPDAIRARLPDPAP